MDDTTVALAILVGLLAVWVVLVLVAYAAVLIVHALRGRRYHTGNPLDCPFGHTHGGAYVQPYCEECVP